MKNASLNVRPSIISTINALNMLPPIKSRHNSILEYFQRLWIASVINFIIANYRLYVQASNQTL
jgi:hypothetical protein